MAGERLPPSSASNLELTNLEAGFLPRAKPQALSSAGNLANPQSGSALGSKFMPIRSKFAGLLGIVLLAPAAALVGQAPATSSPASATPHASGTVKTVNGGALVLTTAAGADVGVTVPAGASVLLVQPGSRDLKSAQAGTAADIATGDRIIVNGTAGDPGGALNATRIIVMKSGAIAATRATEQAAWAQGVGGIVRTVDPATGNLTVASGLKTIAVSTSPATSVKRYAGASIRFEDAVPSTLAALHPGDQVRVRGAKNADGTAITADAIVAGSFSNFSGLLTAVDLANNTVTLTDLASKHAVTVSVPPSSNVRRLPAAAAAGVGARTEGASGEHAPATRPAGGTPTGNPGEEGAARTHSGAGMRGGAGGDLSRMINRLPPESLSDLKPGDAVMIVATNGESQPTAITLLAGVESILAAHPSGETTLSPWNIGGGEAAAEGGGEGSSR